MLTEEKDASSPKEESPGQRALSLFGEMRHSTPDEKAAYRDMLHRLSAPVKEGQSLLDFLPDSRKADGD